MPDNSVTEHGMTAIIARMREDIDKAQHTADTALSGIASHEKVCALRYETITTKLESMPKIYDKLEQLNLGMTTRIAEMSGRVNVATGVWIGALGVAGIVALVLTLLQISHGGH